MEDPATPYLCIMCLVLKILRVLNQTSQYKKLKNGEIVSLTLKITDQKYNIVTNGLGTTVVLHIQ